ncbi:MAG: biotin carboxylase N-terminal domain-containing protein, partial [Myxococcota bacterium]
MSAPDTDRKPIHRLAIANRGEAALRCIRAVKSLREREGSDLQVIALFTDVDRDAPFVRYADQALELPMESGAVAAYLDHDTIMDALRRADADAVWPGWGFLAEDPSFVDRVTEAGLVFLGPSASSMRSVGDKIAAKKLAEENGVAVTPWSGSALVDEDDAARHAEFIGFPMIIKASAGGGGRGIRVVERPHEIKEAFRAARAEAASAFGDDRLFCESFVRGGRHIEIQIAADCEGNVLALGPRDCSVQRRHQKIVEEAPPPDLAADLRAEMEDAAVKLAQSVGYVGVGTVEFLLSAQGAQFLEINPRLQVEHGITEEITGLDLVELQIRIARGESIANLEVREHGVAIEARVCAEDPDAGFMPSPGSIALFDPSLGPRLRLDSGVSGGSTVPADFDSLIAKVIATGETREEARARLVCALRDFQLVVRGGATNKGYLLQLLESDAYRRGAVDTGWLDRWNQARKESDDVAGVGARDALVAAAILAYQR